MRLCIFGTGYVGLVTATCLAELGHTVVAMDRDRETVARLAAGVPTLYEPGLEEMLGANLDAGRLRFTMDPEEAVNGAEIVFVCVGTPPREDGSADLTQVEEVSRTIAPLLNGYKLIVEKSTVPVNTAWWIDRTIRRFASGSPQFDVASNPEFLREGSAIHDFLHPDRIVVGAVAERARVLLSTLYAGFDCPVIMTDVKTAELIKHAGNAFLATKVSFINMVADLCEATGVDVTDVAEAIGLDARIGPAFLQAGVGFGGSCLPKDLKALVKIAEEVGIDVGLLREVDRINEQRVARLVKKVERALWVVRDKRVALLGLAFKPNTDDVRQAPSLKVAQRLLDLGATLQVYDPQAASSFARIFPANDRIRYTQSAYDAAADAHALVILTDWDEFRGLDLERIRGLMCVPIVVDGRNMFDPDEMRALGFEYYGLGQPDAVPAAVRLPVEAAR